MNRRVLLAAGLAAGLVPAAGARAVTALSEETFGFSHGSFLMRGTGARSEAMGGAFTAVADDPTAVSWNPGGTGQLDSLGIAATYDAAGDGMGLSYLAAAVPAGNLVAGGALTALHYGSYAVTDVNGFRLGSGDATDYAFALSFAGAHPAWLLGGHGWSGVAFEFVSEAEAGTLLGLSGGTVIPLGEDVTGGIAVQHLTFTSPDEFGLPSILHGGLAYRATPSLRIAADGGYGLVTKQMNMAGGAEWAPVKAFAVRVGYRWRPENSSLGSSAGVTAGAGLSLAGFSLDYAYEPFGDLLTSHRVSLAWRAPVWHALPSESAVITKQNVDGIYQEGLSSYKAGRYAQAQKSAETVVNASPLYWQGFVLLGDCRLAQGDRLGALDQYHEALRLNPDEPAIVDRVARLTAAPVQPAPAAQAPSAADKSHAAYVAAINLYKASDVDHAYAKAIEALNLDNTNWEAWQLLGNCQFAKGDKAAALRSFQASLQLHPDNPDLKEFVGQIGK